jgi:hypothetical protein
MKRIDIIESFHAHQRGSALQSAVLRGIAVAGIACALSLLLTERAHAQPLVMAVAPTDTWAWFVTLVLAAITSLVRGGGRGDD